MKNMNENDLVCAIVDYNSSNKWFGFTRFKDVPENIIYTGKWLAYTDGKNIYIFPEGGNEDE